MTDSDIERKDVGAELLQQDERLSTAEYEEYRMKLEMALNRAERSDRLVTWVLAISFAVAIALMFVGGFQLFGPFDPTDPGASAISITLGVIYVVAQILFPICLATYFFRIRPRLTQAKSDIRDADFLALQREVSELREQLAATSASNREVS